MIRTNNKRVALYARFSSDNQRTESIDAQIRAMTTYCEQNGYTIVKTYVDEAKSATTDRRPSFQQMIKDSSNHEFDVLLVHKLDRFARNRYDSAVYKLALKKNGVTVQSALENLDSSPEGIILESVLEGMSEYYSQNLSREVFKGMTETALQCKHTGGIPALGYDVDPITRKLVINPYEAEIVRLIFDMFVQGFTYNQIIAELTRQGYKGKHGRELKKNCLHEILKNEKYKGTYVYNRTASKNADGRRNSHLKKPREEQIVIPGGCPAIVSEETFEKAQKKLQANKRLGGSNKAKELYLLSGKVFCRECGYAMHGNHHGYNESGVKLTTYRCPSRRKDCNNKEINRGYLEEYVIWLLEREIFNSKALRRLVKAIEARSGAIVTNIEDDRERIDRAIAEIEVQLKNVADAVASGLLSEALITRLKELENEKNRLITEKAHLNGEMSGHAVDIDTKYIMSEYARLKKAPSHPAYREYIQNFIDSISIGRYTVYITLKTGLDVFPELNKTYEKRRQVIYEKLYGNDRASSCKQSADRCG